MSGLAAFNTRVADNHPRARARAHVNVSRVVPCSSKMGDQSRTQPHVEQKLQRVALLSRGKRVHVLRSEPRGITKNLSYVLGLEVRVILENLLDRCTVGEVREHDRHRDPHPANARTTSKDLRVKDDPVKHGVLGGSMTENIGSRRAASRLFHG